MLPGPGEEGHVQHDGLGTRRAALDARWGHVEILDVSQELSTPIAEVAVRAAASRLPRAGSVLSPVHAIERTGSSLRVISGVVDGLRLSDLLEALDAQTLRLPDEALLVRRRAAEGDATTRGRASAAIGIVLSHPSRLIPYRR